MCVCIYACTIMCVRMRCVCHSMQVKLRGSLSTDAFFASCRIQGLLLFHSMIQARWSTSIQELSCLLLPYPWRNAAIAGTQATAASFYVASWVSNSGPHTCVANTLPSEPWPSPAKTLFIKHMTPFFFSLCGSYSPCYNFSTLLLQPRSNQKQSASG